MMDRLWAIKKEFEPFRWVIPGITALGILPIFRCTFYLCPYCRWSFKITWGPLNSLLGSGERTCWHCHQVFWDGSNEWPEMSSEEQRLFIFPITVCGLLGACIIVPALLVWTEFVVRHSVDFRNLLFFTPFVLPLALWFGFRSVQVTR